MELVLVTATGLEMEAVLRHANVSQARSCRETRAVPGTTGLVRSSLGTVRLLVCGVGPLNAAFFLGRFLARRNIAGAPATCLVLNLGIAGSYDPGRAPLGALVRASREIWPEYGLWQGAARAGKGLAFPQARQSGHDVFQEMDLEPAVPEEWANQNALGRIAATCHSFLSGPAVTVAGVSGTPERAAALSRATGGLTESMEGFALALGALHAGCAFLEVRAVSNAAGYRPPERWDMATALDALATAGRLLLPGRDNA